MRQVWGATTVVDTRTVDVHVRRIRRKLGDGSAIIGTVRGVGYRVEQEHQVLVEGKS
jgi:two-component system, OmpR family, phosphate regulon response regulator PhoB